MASYRILIVEDQREISRLLRSALETLEHDIQVVELPSGEEATLDKSHKKIDLLVADYRLPGMTGIELMEKVRSQYPRIKVILITGQSDPEIRKAVAEAGADAFFIKPVPMANFLDAVERHLGMVETLLPPEPIAPEDEESDNRSTLPDLLANLRQEVQATAVLLVDDSGRVRARAGDLPDDYSEVSLLSSLLSIDSAGQKISRFLGQKKSSFWSVFDGGEFDLVFSPLGDGNAMVILGKGISDTGRIMKTISMLNETKLAIEASLHESIEPLVAIKVTPPAAQEPSEGAETDDKVMEPILKSSKKKMKTAELNEFWDEAATKHKAPAKPDRLTYEQAEQLGLTPKEQK